MNIYIYIYTLIAPQPLRTHISHAVPVVSILYRETHTICIVVIIIVIVIFIVIVIALVSFVTVHLNYLEQQHMSISMKLVKVIQTILSQPSLRQPSKLLIYQAVVCVPSQVCPGGGSVLAPSARGDLSQNNTFAKVLKVLSMLRRQATPTRAHLQLPEYRH